MTRFSSVQTGLGPSSTAVSTHSTWAPEQSTPWQPTPTIEPNWIYITIRRSGRKSLDISRQSMGNAHTLVLDPMSDKYDTVRDFIWDEFESLMSEIETKRQALVSPRYYKGSLKMGAPIPWLWWASACGKSGQTRNKDNFIKIWETHVGGCVKAGAGRCQVTSILLPADASFASITSGSLTVTYECDEDNSAESVSPRPRCDSGVAFTKEQCQGT